MKRLILSILCFFIANCIFATNIRGRILLEKSDKRAPYENITVYLAGNNPSDVISNETETTSDGMYYLYNIKPGKYYLVFAIKKMVDNNYIIGIKDTVEIEIPDLGDEKNIFYDIKEIILK